MLKAYRYRLYPNQSQITHLVQSMGCSRYIYNLALESKIKNYQLKKENLTYLNFNLTEVKSKLEWLKSPYSQILQMSLRNLDMAFTKFFKKESGFPNFKKKCNKQSIQYPQNIKVDWDTSKLIVPKCGEISAILHRKFEGDIKTTTISKSTTNKFYVSILVDDGKELPKKLPIQESTAIGIDVGIKTFATTSNGEIFENPKFLCLNTKKLAIRQRELSRKMKGSNNRSKARLKVARIHEKIQNQRNDYLHKISFKLIRENQTICLEDLNVSGMLKNHKLARSISDCSWSAFVGMLQYKAEFYGKNIAFCGRFDPSSKICSKCGWIKKDLTLADRSWKCGGCHTIHDRDVNAAINIKKFALIKLTPLERREESVEIVHENV
jgi:putative transposase